MAKAKENIIGQKFNKLTAVAESEGVLYGDRVRRKILCICDCGAEKIVQLGALKSGHSKSCGCVKNKWKSKLGNLNYLPLYTVWKNMQARCYDPNHKYYKYYGGQGVTMCDEWKTDFDVFFKWAMSNGWEKGFEIDRYPDMKGNYCQDNCRVATKSQNKRNKSNNRMVEYNGEVKTIAEWSEVTGVSFAAIKHRLDRCWRVEDLFLPATKEKRYLKGARLGQ